MNFELTNIPERAAKPRENGINMVMDKGLSCREVEDLISVSEGLIDLIKIGFGTSYATPNLKEKLKIYKDAGIPTYFGGTLFEAFAIRDQFDDYLKALEEFNMTHVEVSDGSIEMDHDKKCEYIQTLAKDYTVLSEVGSKNAEKIIPSQEWVSQMQSELNAGAWKVIGEAREGGNVGLFQGSGEAKSDLIEEILAKIPEDKIVWEAPLKTQQVWFVKLLGTNVNLGNIAPSEIIPLETIRLGLRGDTFEQFLNQ